MLNQPVKQFCLIFAVFSALEAQQPVASTPEQVGSPRGENTGGYNITNSFELGNRFSNVVGNVGEYRSDVNYGNGIRLLGSSLTINSKDGHGPLFDEIVLNTQGLGNDPYQSVTLRVQKNGLYRYDMTWRLSDYFNPGLTVAAGEHFMNTSRRLQDHDFTLFPQKKFRLHAGYSRNTEDGPALSTAQEFNANGSAFPVFSDVRRQWNEYRAGADGEFAGFKFTVMRTWDFYKDDTPFSSQGVIAAGTATDQTVLQQFNQSAPLHGRSPGWLGNLTTRRKYWALNARLSYVKGVGDFALDQSAAGIGQFGNPATRQITVGGEATRPETTGDVNISLFPTERLTVTNNSSISSDRIDGNSTYSEFLTGLNLGASISFNQLGIRTVVNNTDINYRLNNWIGFYGGYHYSDRQLTTVEGSQIPASPASLVSNTYVVTNILNSGVAGVRLHPLKPLTISLDGELGHANAPLTPISAQKYHTLNGRIAYRVKNLQLSTTYREVYNINAPFTFTYSNSHSRNYSANASWTPINWFSIDASYSKLHLDSLSFLAFFAGVTQSQLQTDFSSLYLSNIHAGNLTVRLGLPHHADLYLGYSITKDTGDGRPTAVPAGVTDPVQALLSSVQTFPLTYQSPMARLSLQVTPKIRWNVGWQYYNYGQQFQIFSFYQNFHANTGYTSVLWTF